MKHFAIYVHTKSGEENEGMEEQKSNFFGNDCLGLFVVTASLS